jgi:tetratricopeptide (TPR) repeat protein
VNVHRRPSTHEGQRLVCLIALALAVLACVVHAGVMHHELVQFDDNIVLDPALPGLRAGLSPAGIQWACTSVEADNWMPLTRLSWLLDVSLFGFGPQAFLLGNLFYHAVATTLLFAALRAMTGATGRSALAAALFAVHPLHVESVAWAAERKDVVCGAFWMATLLAYAAFVRRPSPARYGLVFASMALALLAKPMAVSLPFVLLLLDVWPLGRVRTESVAAMLRTLHRPVLEKLPLLVLSAASSFVTYYTQQEGGSLRDFEVFPLPVRLANAALAPWTYLRKFFWPTDLAVFYPHPGDAISYPAAGVAALALLLVTLFAILAARRRPYVTVGWLWFLGTLLPVIGIAQVGFQALADRYMYIPLVGLAIVCAWGANELADRLRVGIAARTGLSAALVAAFAAGSVLQVRHWQDSETLFQHALDVTRDNWLVHVNLGLAKQLKNDHESASLHFKEALRIRPRMSHVHMSHGRSLWAKGRGDEAIAEFRTATEIDPSLGPLLDLTLRTYAEGGGAQEAIRAYAELVRMEPDSAEPRVRLARAYLGNGRDADAAAAYREALRLQSPWPEIENNLALILATSEDPTVRDPREAIRLAESAVAAFARKDAGSLDTLAAAYEAAGRRGEALTAAREALARADEQGRVEAAKAIRTRIEALATQN